MSEAPPPYPGEKGGMPQAQPGGYPMQAPPPAGQPYQQPYPGQAPPPGQPYPHGQAPPPAAQYGAPPASQYPPVGQQTVVITQQPRVMVGTHYSEVPVTTQCPHCHAQITTGIQYESGTMTWLASGGICLVGCFFLGITWLGCCLIPFCVDSCKDIIHTCPNCKQMVGRKSRM